MFDENFLKAIKIGIYRLSLIHCRNRSWSHEGSSPPIPTKQYKYKNICYICIDEIFDNFDNYTAAMVE